MAKSSQAELDRLLEKWQRILRLQDWDVKIKFATYGELDGHEGDCNVVLERKHATIRILRPEHFDATEKDLPYNLEDTVIHELLHIYFEACHIDEQYKKAEETAICMLADALLRLEGEDE